MLWHRRAEERYYRWHRRWALFPRRVGEYRVWLQSYAWRRLRPEEEPKLGPFYLPSPMIIKLYTEWQLASGYAVRREKFTIIGNPIWSNSWYRVTEEYAVDCIF